MKYSVICTTDGEIDSYRNFVNAQFAMIYWNSLEFDKEADSIHEFSVVSIVDGNITDILVMRDNRGNCEIETDCGDPDYDIVCCFARDWVSASVISVFVAKLQKLNSDFLKRIVRFITGEKSRPIPVR